MSLLLAKQQQFFFMLSSLFAKAVELAIPLKLGRGLCCESCSTETSLHRSSLALDLLWVKPDGSFATWEDYRPLGEYWESLGGSWGGRFDLNGDGVSKDDANHFSLAFGRRR